MYYVAQDHVTNHYIFQKLEFISPGQWTLRNNNYSYTHVMFITHGTTVYSTFVSKDFITSEVLHMAHTNNYMWMDGWVDG